MGRKDSGIVEELKRRLEELLQAIGEALGAAPEPVPVKVRPNRRQ